MYTGNIETGNLGRLGNAVYPCVYREHVIRMEFIVDNTGLSLCIQGTFEKYGVTGEELRFIPVYTGNIPIITYCFIIKILTTKFLPIFLAIFYLNLYL